MAVESNALILSVFTQFVTIASKGTILLVNPAIQMH